MINNELLMELSDCGSTSGIAKIIHSHIPLNSEGYVDLELIAKSIGIINISTKPLDQFEGILVTNPEKTKASIVVNSNNSPERQRFTIAHEIGHFLIPTHNKNSSCAATDLSAYKSKDVKKNKEAEANSFAAELLIPASDFKKRINKEPDLEFILTLAGLYKVSKEALLRRYINLTDYSCALIFGRGNKTRGYPQRTKDFPYIDVTSDDNTPEHIAENLKKLDVGDISDWYEIDTHYILSDPTEHDGCAVYAQTFKQQNNYHVSLLSFEEE